MREAKHIAALKRELKALRNFPVNTTPVSRHLELMADALAVGDGYSMFQDDPEHCAVTMYAVLIGYYKALDKSSCGCTESRSAERQVSDSLHSAGREKPQRSDERPLLGLRQVGAKVQVGPQSLKDTSAGVASGPQDSLSPGGFKALCPRGEREPSVTLACTPGESNSASAETCGGVESRHPGKQEGTRNSSDTPLRTPSSWSVDTRKAGVAPSPQDSIPLPRFIPPEAGALASHPLPVTAGAALSLDEYWSDFFDRRKATALRVMASKATQVPKSSDIPNHHQ